MQVPHATVASNAGVGGVAVTGVSGAAGLAWQICVIALVISIGFALLRFVPRAER